MKKGRTNVIKNPFGERAPQPEKSPENHHQYSDPYVREEPPFARAYSGQNDVKPKPFYPGEEAFATAQSFAPSPFPQEGPAEAKGEVPP